VSYLFYANDSGDGDHFIAKISSGNRLPSTGAQRRSKNALGGKKIRGDRDPKGPQLNTGGEKDDL